MAVAMLVAAVATAPSAVTDGSRSAQQRGRRGERASPDADQDRVAGDSPRDLPAGRDLRSGRRRRREVVVLQRSLARAQHAGVAAGLQEAGRRRGGGQEHGRARDPRRAEEHARAGRHDREARELKPEAPAAADPRGRDVGRAGRWFDRHGPSMLATPRREGG